jgi:hypothetical protein
LPLALYPAVITNFDQANRALIAPLSLLYHLPALSISNIFYYTNFTPAHSAFSPLSTPLRCACAVSRSFICLRAKISYKASSSLIASCPSPQLPALQSWGTIRESRWSSRMKVCYACIPPRPRCRRMLQTPLLSTPNPIVPNPQSSPRANSGLLCAVNLNHFRLLRVVGKGAFGKVRIVERKDTGLTFALKYIRKDEGWCSPILGLPSLCVA